ncbi:MAG: hypothetical protein AB1325_14015 [Nitrospirota bacterium]
MINQVIEIKNPEFTSLLNKYEEYIKHISHDPLFIHGLRSYHSILRSSFNLIQDSFLDDLIQRLHLNRELERELEKQGGYTIDFLNGKNPKEALIAFIQFLKANKLKLNCMINHLKSFGQKKIIISDINDFDFLRQILAKQLVGNFRLLNYKEIKKTPIKDEIIIFYSLDGRKDFELIYELNAKVDLILYSPEKQILDFFLQKRKREIEAELLSQDRFKICGIKYEKLPDLPIELGKTIEGILERIEHLSEKEFENYKEDSDEILAYDERIIYEVTYQSHNADYLEASETVFNENADLIKVFKVQEGDKIRVYPKEKFPEKLYSIARDMEIERFADVERDSFFWQQILKDLNQKYMSALHRKLKEKGLKVSELTVKSYLDGKRKFPMYFRDMVAMADLSNDIEFKNRLPEIKKSKRLYNSTMIALGKGLKQEIKLFLKEEDLGEILSKLKFTKETLRQFIDKYMPLKTVRDKTIYEENHQIEQLGIFNFHEGDA